MSNTSRAGTPWYFWVISIVALLWNAVGAYDYLMTQTENAAYMAKFTEAQLEFFYGFPTWVVAAWAIAVWTAVLGSILLLLRKRLAAPVFLISLVGFIVTAVHNYGMSNAMEVTGTGALLFSVLIFLVGVGLYLFSRAMSKRGILT